MDLAHFSKLAIAASIVLLVFALGLRATFADATSFFRGFLRPPHRLMRAVLVMYLIVPAVAVAVALAVDLSKPVRAALVAMAVAPIPPILPRKQLKLGGGSDYVFGLLVAMSIASVVMVPICVWLLGLAFGRDASFGPDAIAKLIGTTVLVPLLAGLTVAHFAPAVARRVAPTVAGLGNVLLVAGALPVLIGAWPALVSLAGGGTIPAMLAVIAFAIVAGHRLGGPAPDERATLALAAAMRHPGIALAIATLNVPEEPRIPAAILLYMLTAMVATFVYGRWQRRKAAP
jgi:BASS family bile acid:Na+ symporter